jgi:hypothetical protein
VLQSKRTLKTPRRVQEVSHKRLTVLLRFVNSPHRQSQREEAGEEEPDGGRVDREPVWDGHGGSLGRSDGGGTAL